MCGFCGVLAPEPGQILSERVTRMVATLQHRGPDAEGVFVGEGVALGHRRLSIIDLSELGAQPMTLPHSAVWVTYNGEIYNFRDLRARLEARGHTFRGNSDTEVVLAVYEEGGLDALRTLEGIFGFALWDQARRRLVLMRDRLGVKPLFYSWAGHALLFGSEIKAILAAGGVSREIDEQALSEYLWYGNSFDDRTMFRAVRAVPPGHWLVVEQGVPRVEAWWRIEEWFHAPAASPPTLAEAAVEVREALDAAVGRQLVSDVPVGIFLSGGVDSSAIAASAARQSSRPLDSYSVGFDFDRGVNELPKARQVAAALHLRHHELHVTGDHLADVVVQLARAHDEPFADAANIPLFLLSQALGGSVKVVLQGDGGDEMFAGYRRYAILRHSQWWSRWPRVLTPLVKAAGERGLRAARMLDATGAVDPALRMALLLTMETQDDSPFALFGGDTRRRLQATDPFVAFRRCASRFAAVDPVDRMLLTDIHLQLPSQFLAKVDRATMAHGIEARVPLLDERVAALAVRLPSRLKVDGAGKKVVLREAMRGRVPDEILDGPKTGFGVPYQHWLRGALYNPARDAIFSQHFLQRFDVDRPRLERLVEAHRAGTHDRGFLMWKIYQLAIWSSLYA